MKRSVILTYTGIAPVLGEGVRLAPEAAVIGRVHAGMRLTLGRLATLRADGDDIRLGADCRFGERSTVHIADEMYPTVVGDRLTVGRYALVHACMVGNDCLVGDTAVIMDGAQLGDGAVVAAGALVPPRKELAGGWLYQGNPVRAVREIDRREREGLRQDLVDGRDSILVRADDLPALDHRPYRPREGPGPLYGLAGAQPQARPGVYVAPTAVVAGDVRLAEEASVWFGCVLRCEGTRIRVGPRSNIQDNSILITDGTRGAIDIGADVTFGHNVRMGACVVEDEALIGMGAEVGDGVVVERGACIGARSLVEPGTVVKAGCIWAGRPAREFRRVKREEMEFFLRGKDIYLMYARNYLAERA